AARTVNARILQVCGGRMNAEALLAAGAENLQRCGTSMRKVQYMLGVAEAVQSGKLDLSAIAAMDDVQVIQTLTDLKGIGIWTAEMLMIFSLGRPDVLSWGDLAIQRGMMRLYNHKALPRDRFERYRRRYSPYGSNASLYLWALSKSLFGYSNCCFCGVKAPEDLRSSASTVRNIPLHHPSGKSLY